MKKHCLLCVLFICTALVANTQIIDPLKINTGSKTSAILFEDKIHHFGVISYGSEAIHSFKFKNTCQEPVTIRVPRVSNPCLIATWPEEQIAPGQSNEINVIYNTKRTGRIQQAVYLEFWTINHRVSIDTLYVGGYVLSEIESSDDTH